FSGHAHPVRSIHWRANDEIMAVLCADGALYVWQLKTGHLDRVEYGETADDIISECDCRVTLQEYGQDYRYASVKRTVSVFPIYSSLEDSPPLFIFLVNIKRLINDIYTGHHILTPPSTPEQSLRRHQKQTHTTPQHHRSTSSGGAGAGGAGSGGSGTGSPSSPRTAAAGMSGVQRLQQGFQSILKNGSLPNVAGGSPGKSPVSGGGGAASTTWVGGGSGSSGSATLGAPPTNATAVRSRSSSNVGGLGMGSGAGASGGGGLNVFAGTGRVRSTSVVGTGSAGAAVTPTGMQRSESAVSSVGMSASEVGGREREESVQQSQDVRDPQEQGKIQEEGEEEANEETESQQEPGRRQQDESMDEDLTVDDASGGGVTLTVGSGSTTTTMRRLGGSASPTSSVLVQAIFSAIMSWGVDAEIDRVCVERFGLREPGRHATFGIRGANGYLSILAPTVSADGLGGNKEQGDAGAAGHAEWCISPTLTGSRLLNIMALTRSVLYMKGLEEEVITLLTHYGAMLPGVVGKSFCFPSFSLLAKYWQDPIVDIQQGARSLLQASLTTMSPEQKGAVIDYWRRHLPVLLPHTPQTKIAPGKINLRATIILGMIGCDEPSLLNQRVCKDVAESLDWILKNEDGRSPYKLAAVEIIGTGFSTWEPHINGTSVVRALIQCTGLAVTPASSTATPAVSTGSLLQPGGGGSVHPSISSPSTPVPGGVSGAPSSPRAVAGGTAIAGSASPRSSSSALAPGGIGGAASSASVAGGGDASPGRGMLGAVNSAGVMSSGLVLTPSLITMARQAVFQVATANPGLFVSTLTFDLLHLKSVAEKAGYLKLLGMFVGKLVS
ncbi:hypothetical protein HK102_004739, partial [Quaeritorhiza haematococci]